MLRQIAQSSRELLDGIAQTTDPRRSGSPLLLSSASCCYSITFESCTSEADFVSARQWYHSGHALALTKRLTARPFGLTKHIHLERSDVCRSP